MPEQRHEDQHEDQDAKKLADAKATDPTVEDLDVPQDQGNAVKGGVHIFKMPSE